MAGAGVVIEFIDCIEFPEHDGMFYVHVVRMSTSEERMAARQR
jgi:hypothetical protein